MTTRRCIFALAFFVCIFGIPHSVSAATLYVDPFTANVYKGDTITVAVRLDTDTDECVNTVDAVIHYSESIQAIDISLGKSILTLWIEPPVINVDAHTITCAGGIPNGYCGRIPGDPSLTNILAEIVFRAPGFSVGRSDDTSALISFDPGTRALLNDGYGTEAPLKTIQGTINLIQQVGSTTVDAWRGLVTADTIPPEPLGIDLVQNSQVFNGKYYIVFNTTDKQSGIDHYEVLEEARKDLYTFRFGRSDAPWTVAESPYVLGDQGLRSTIRVRAIDKAGNEEITTLVPDESLRPVQLLLVGALGIGVLVLLGIVILIVRWLLRRRRTIPTALESE